MTPIPSKKTDHWIVIFVTWKEFFASLKFDPHNYAIAIIWISLIFPRWRSQKHNNEYFWHKNFSKNPSSMFSPYSQMCFNYAFANNTHTWINRCVSLVSVRDTCTAHAADTRLPIHVDVSIFTWCLSFYLSIFLSLKAMKVNK